MRTARGFTLVELVMVIILIGIIAAYAAPRFDRDGFEVRNASGEVIEAIRYAQTLALQHSGLPDDDGDTNQDFYTFQVAGNGYTVAIGDSNTTHGNVSNPMSGAASYTQSWAAGEVALATTTANIYFNSRGEPVNSAGNSLAADTTITVTVGGESDTLTVEQLSGFVHR